MPRFADDKLQDFYNNFLKHTADEEEYRLKTDKLLSNLIEAVEMNTVKMTALKKDTQNIVDIHRNWTVGKKMAVGIGRFAMWLSSLAVFVAIYHYLSEHFTK